MSVPRARHAVNKKVVEPTLLQTRKSVSTIANIDLGMTSPRTGPLDSLGGAGFQPPYQEEGPSSGPPKAGRETWGAWGPLGVWGGGGGVSETACGRGGKLDPSPYPLPWAWTGGAATG